MALTPLTGELWGQPLVRTDHAYFLTTLTAHQASLPRTVRRAHDILDNGPAHTARATRAWVAA